ncbi:PEP-CTERM sorting domain-containing protein [Isosphaeraceae bacterium EP7]
MSHRRLCLLLVAVAGLLVAGQAPVQAEIIVKIVKVKDVPDPSLIYSIELALPSGSEIAKGDFITLGIIPGLVIGTNNQPSNWAATYPTSEEVTWSYIGRDPLFVETGQDELALGMFTIQSESDFVPRFLDYSGQTTSPLDGSKQPFSGRIAVTNESSVPFAVPEPSTVVMSALGLAAVLATSRKRVARAAAFGR